MTATTYVNVAEILDEQSYVYTIYAPTATSSNIRFYVDQSSSSGVEFNQAWKEYQERQRKIDEVNNHQKKNKMFRIANNRTIANIVWKLLHD